MDSTSCKRMADKQREDYMNLLARIPNLFDRFKNVKVNDHVTVSITADPIRKEDEVTTGNTYYVMLKASCIVIDTDEGETNTFHFDVLKIPIYTNMGYHIRNLDRMILDVILKNDKYFLKFYKRYGISELFMVNYRHDFIRKEFMP